MFFVSLLMFTSCVRDHLFCLICQAFLTLHDLVSLPSFFLLIMLVPTPPRFRCVLLDATQYWRYCYTVSGAGCCMCGVGAAPSICSVCAIAAPSLHIH